MKRHAKLLALVLALAMALALAACGGNSSGGNSSGGNSSSGNGSGENSGVSTEDMVYAVEAGSAGEAAALENGWEVNSVDSQARALMEVEAGTSDAAVIDLLMASAMVGEGPAIRQPDLYR